MKLSNESRLEELMKFKSDFNDKLKNAYKLYEQRSKTFCKNNNNIENSEESSFKKKKTRNLPKIQGFGKNKNIVFKSAFDEEDGIDYIKLRKVGKCPIKLMSNTWKPQFMVCDYFEKYKRLQPKYEMSIWEQVIIYYFL